MVIANKSKSRITKGERVFNLFNTLIMIIIIVITIYPFWHIIVTSLSGIEMSSGLIFWPKKFTIDAYKSILSYDMLWSGYKNTIFRCLLGTTLSVFFTVLTAYPLSKKELPFRNGITNYILFTMMFGGGMIPSYLLVKDLGMLNTIWALVIPGMIGGYNIFIVRNFLKSIPASLEESALIDGAGWLRIWVSIVVPLSKPVIATIGLWSFVGHWNAWFDAMIYIQDPRKSVLQIILRRITIENNPQDMNQLMESMSNVNSFSGKTIEAAIIVVSIVPMLIIYPFLQKYFVKGIMIGSVKE